MLSITRDSENPGGYLLEAETVLPRPLDEVFSFFADAMNLERITPPWMHFHVITPTPIEMFAGQTIDYRLKVHLVPVRWRTEIALWEPPYRFADLQLRGPYRYWWHEHYFDEVHDGTRCRDTVRYGVPGGSLVHTLLVRRDVRAIFAYRENVMHRILGPLPTLQSS
jgi:ligand-binding SRPBCC domain-containing protein